MNLLYKGFGEDGSGTSVKVDGIEYPIHYQYYFILKIMELLDDSKLDERERAILVLRYFYVDKIPPDPQKAITAMFDFINKANYVSYGKKSSNKEDKQLYDYWQDHQIIYASMCQAYGETWYEWHWWRWKAAFDNLPSDTPIKEVISIRGRKIYSKMSSEEKKNIQELKQIYALKKTSSGLLSAKQLEEAVLKNHQAKTTQYTK